SLSGTRALTQALGSGGRSFLAGRGPNRNKTGLPNSSPGSTHIVHGSATALPSCNLVFASVRPFARRRRRCGPDAIPSASRESLTTLPSLSLVPPVLLASRCLS